MSRGGSLLLRLLRGVGAARSEAAAGRTRGSCCSSPVRALRHELRAAQGALGELGERPCPVWKMAMQRFSCKSWLLGVRNPRRRGFVEVSAPDGVGRLRAGCSGPGSEVFLFGFPLVLRGYVLLREAVLRGEASGLPRAGCCKAGEPALGKNVC